MKKNQSLYWELFKSTFYISTFTFGGGYVIVPLMQKRFSDELAWIERDEMIDLVAIGQSAPGPIAVNTSILVGYRMAGIKGAIVTMIGTILPPLIIMSIVTYIYLAIRDNPHVQNVMLGMQAGIAAIIINVVYDMAKRIIIHKNPVHIAVMIISLVLAIGFDINVIWLLLLAAIVGIITSFISMKQGGQ